MDHKQKHALHHRKEREHEKEKEKEREHKEEQQLRVIHPTWFLVLGIILIFGVVIVWTLFN